MSVVSLARTAGVTGEPSKRRSRMVSAWFELADISMMSTRPWRVISRICSRYSSSVLDRTSPGCASGERPGAPMPNAMSASLASARRNSRQPGSARIVASFRSSDLSIPAPAPLSRDRHPGRAGGVPVATAPGPHRHPDRPGGVRRCGGRGRLRGGGLRRGGILLQDLVDRLAEHLARALEERDFPGEELDLELRLDPLAADDRRDREADVADAIGAVDERGDRQEPLLIERDGVDDLADRQADGEPR